MICTRNEQLIAVKIKTPLTERNRRKRKITGVKHEEHFQGTWAALHQVSSYVYIKLGVVILIPLPAVHLQSTLIFIPKHPI